MVATIAPFDYGTGALGGVTISTSHNMAGGVYNYQNLTINQFVTLTITGHSPLIISFTGTCAINGKTVAAWVRKWMRRYRLSDLVRNMILDVIS